MKEKLTGRIGLALGSGAYVSGRLDEFEAWVRGLDSQLRNSPMGRPSEN